MFSKEDLFKCLNKFKDEYLNKDKSYYQDDEYLYKRKMASCELLDEFLKYYNDNPNEFSPFRKYFFYMAMSTLVYSNFFHVFYHCLVESLLSIEHEWSEVSLEEFKRADYAEYDIEHSIKLSNKIKMYFSKNT